MLQFKCFRIATIALRYNGDRQIHEKLRVLSLADYIKALIESLLMGGAPFFFENVADELTEF